MITCTDVPGPVRTDSDVRILVDCGLDVLAEADTVSVPASDSDYTSVGAYTTVFDAASPKR